MCVCVCVAACKTQKKVVLRKHSGPNPNQRTLCGPANNDDVKINMIRPL